MWESVGALTASPWFYGLIAVSVLLDVFLPVLPSGVLVAAAATAAAAGTGAAAAGADAMTGAASTADAWDLVVLTICAATASVLGDLAAFRVGLRGGPRLHRIMSRSRRLRTAQARLGAVLAHGGGALFLVARFAPAGRSVVSLGAGVARRRVREFLPWSVLAGISWAGYSVALGYFGGEWLGTGWLTTAVSVLSLFLAGSAAAFLLRRPAQDTGGATA
ncbi:VTT domain-containing protein [Streptomyces sp. MJP52]|uniref:DedA family protein n=1 Tax=Streptomyces sp. MJP52 TaxID=2940555 RepID=UPI0024764C52|nr:VTT domain-containing protein [Streptomyces sp. MJP52]MDH6227163.1 membrane protein DedA with SNARE-associated domain [Streptomyces sp. MJP52]